MNPDKTAPNFLKSSDLAWSILFAIIQAYERAENNCHEKQDES